MGSVVTKESMEFIVGEIMDTAHASSGLEDGISLIQDILEGNGIIEVISD